jgi:hypothetical protein
MAFLLLPLLRDRLEREALLSAERLFKAAAIGWQLDPMGYVSRGMRTGSDGVVVRVWEKSEANSLEGFDVTPVENFVCRWRRVPRDGPTQNLGCITIQP